MSGAVLYAGGGFTVTERLLRTPRKSYAVDRIEFVAVERPLLLFAVPPALGLIGFAAVFRRYLYAGEIATLLAVCAVAILAAMLVGTLKVHSVALKDSEVASSLGLVTRLRQVRDAVERAMALRGNHPDASSYGADA